MGIKSFLERLKFKFKKKDRILTDLDEDTIKKEKLIKELVKKNQSLEAQLSHISAKKRKDKTEERNLQEDLSLVQELAEEQEKIENERYYGSFDLAKLFRNLPKKKYHIDISDKDDKVIFDRLKTIRILNDGSLAIQGKSEQIWSEGISIRDLIFSPESFKNQIKRKRILMPYDKDFNRSVDLNEIKEGEVSYNPDSDEWNIGEEKRRKVTSMLIDRDKLIQDLREDKKHKEQLISDLRNKIQDMELAKDSWKHQAENSQKELSIALENEKLMSGGFNVTDRNYTIAMEQKALLEEVKDKYERAFDEITEELEDEKARTKIKKAKLEVWNDIQRARKVMPEKTRFIEGKPVEEKEEPVNQGGIR